MSMAAASIPQSYVPGKSLAALGAATYRGESGFAVGVSTITDNGKWVFKVNGTGDTRGNFGCRYRCRLLILKKIILEANS